MDYSVGSQIEARLYSDQSSTPKITAIVNQYKGRKVQTYQRDNCRQEVPNCVRSQFSEPISLTFKRVAFNPHNRLLASPTNCVSRRTDQTLALLRSVL
jgi:hypothetical protein